ncbi:hypothetical protein L208DRAFT_1395762 [Tricholoma matsutake]|nr:hypothetical protein L208DRAFT_1395762 [Tricholoma matsutake 945]
MQRDVMELRLRNTSTVLRAKLQLLIPTPFIVLCPPTPPVLISGTTCIHIVPYPSTSTPSCPVKSHRSLS